MQMKNDMQPQQHINTNKEKEKNAIAAFRVHFSSHCQMILTKAEVTLSELGVNCPKYLKFVHMALLSSFEKLHSLKCNLCHGISEEEHTYLNLLRIQSSVDNDEKLHMALNSFHEGFMQYLQITMINASYESSEVEENNVLFLSFLSKVLIIEAEKLIRCESALTTNIANKKRTIDKCSRSESPISPSKEFKLSESSVHIVKTTKRHHIYCVSTPDGIRAMKTTVTDNPVGVENLNNELKIGSRLAYHACRKSYSATTYENKNALLLEWAHGDPLSNIKKLPVTNFFKVAREIVSCLLEMHSNKICHLNLTCDHIIFNNKTNSIKIIGLGSCSSFYSKRSYNPKLLDRDMRFISPEQTGRVNREVDFRSDFYSLGIIFYKLLSGSYPFDSPNTMELIKMHIFQDSSSLNKIDPNIPVPVSDMVSKLMEKDVDSRYQSAKGIMHDIDLIISDYKPGVELVLAQHDMSETSFILPQKLYGRSNEYSKLISVYNRIRSSSFFEIVFVTGNSGMGKTSLVMELNKSVIKNGTFICGKYDLSKSEPFSALIEAVKMLCDIILLEDESLIEKYRSLIQEAVGEEGKLLTNIIDNLHSIIGKQPEIFESYGREAKNRLNYVFIKFIKAIASVSCPLVIVLEDLQWIDTASLDLITAIVESSIKNLMLIGVYRDNEIKDEHKVVDILQSVEKLNVRKTEIKLDNMNHEQVNELISDALCVPALDSYSLTAFIHKKTKGNPFFTKQMLNSLLKSKLIRFCPERSSWQWDSRINNDKEITENVLDLLRQKIQSLDKNAQRALMIASFLGSPFSLSLLELIINDKKGVEDSLATGMIIHYNGWSMGCFVHDQVQHAAKSLLPKDPKPLFLHVARKLWKRLPKVDLDDNICAVVKLFDRVKDMIYENERVKVVELFLLAGKKAMASTAHDVAFKYYKSGIELLDKSSWKTRYDLSLNIYCNAAKSAYCMAKYKIMKEIVEEIFKNVTTALDLVPCYLLLIRMNSDMRRYGEAILHALNILEKLDVTIDPNKSLSKLELMQTKSLVQESIDCVLEIREVEDRTILAAMEILNYTIFSCFFSGDFNLYASVSSKMIELTMKHGISKYSCHGLCTFAVVLCSNGDNSSYELGKLALKLLEKSESKEMIPLVNTSFFCLISPYFAPLHRNIVPMARMTCISLEIGSHHNSSCCAGAFSVYTFFCGAPLSKTIDEICQFEEVLIRRSAVNMAVHQAMLNLHESEIEDPAKLRGDKFDFKYCFEKAGSENDIINTSLICCIIAYIFHDYETSLKLMEICKQNKKYFGIVIFKVMFHFYDGLLALSIARNIERKEKYIKITEENILILKDYAENAPMNYLNKVCLLEAELAAMHKNEFQAKSLYQRAISLSKKHGFVNEEALVCERFAIFYLELESQSDAAGLLLQSYNCYKAWGANSKMLHLIKRYPFLSAALKANAFVLDKSGEYLKVDNESMASVSVLTDDLSSASASTWQNQKRVRLSITK